MNPAEPPPSDALLVRRLAGLWPHREHEANVLLAQFCRLNLHRWRRLDLSTLAPGKDILFCFHCQKLKIDGVQYNP